MLAFLKIHGHWMFWILWCVSDVINLGCLQQVRSSRVAQPPRELGYHQLSARTSLSPSLSLLPPPDSGLVRRKSPVEGVSAGVCGDDAEIGIYKCLRGKRDPPTSQHQTLTANPYPLLRQPLVHLQTRHHARRVRPSSTDKCSHSQDG